MQRMCLPMLNATNEFQIIAIIAIIIIIIALIA